GSLAGLTPQQIEETVIAYEPVWAIGTGKTATSAQAQEVHAFIRKVIGQIAGEAVARQVSIQYGGRVKASTAREIMGQRDGGAAFGGGAVDALIGAGAGNVLTKATKYAAIVFFVLIVSLSLLHANYAKRDVTAVAEQIELQKATSPQTPIPQTAPQLPGISS